MLVDLGRLSEAADVQRQLSAPGPDPLLAHLLAAQARAELARRRAPTRRAGRRGAAVAADPRSADALLALRGGAGGRG